ncbi:hypothetical protein SDD30_08125 [Moorella naiadis]|uniref:fibronectin type III domain-containing protein n=1 Tax=Moorella naiadis (nom. illeg.) TaxID=3093670 RepID=UPI003D9CBD06
MDKKAGGGRRIYKSTWLILLFSFLLFITLIPSAFADTTYRYIVIEVNGYQGPTSGLGGAIINEIIVEDQNGINIVNNLTPFTAYDTATGTLPTYWDYLDGNGSNVWNKHLLTDGSYYDNWAHTTKFLYGNYPSNTNKARFAFDLGTSKVIKDVKVYLGTSQSNSYPPKQLSIYLTNIFSNDQVNKFDNTGLTLLGTINPSNDTVPTLYIVNAPDTTPPSIPTGLTATSLSPTQIYLSWNANTEADLAGYYIYRDNNKIATLGPTTTSYYDNNLMGNMTYTYSIAAFDTSGNVSTLSSGVTATTLMTVPQGLTAIATAYNQVKLNWQQDPDTNLAGYIIYRDYVEIARVGPTATTYIDNGVSPNTQYTYGIKAYGINGTISDISNAATVTTPPVPVVSTPQGLTATALAYNQVQLTWQPNTDPGLAGYIIYRDYVEIARVGPSETSYLDNGAQPNTTYTYGIKAYDSSNNVSDISNAATVTTPPEIAAPTGLKAIASFDHVQLSWNPNTEPTLAGYIIYRDYIEIARVGAGETSYIDNNIIPNTRYIYGIKAYSTSGFISDISNAATMTTPASPKPVVTAMVDGRTIKISWTSSGSGYIYKVLVNNQEVTTTSATSHNYTASTPGYYTVQVVAVAPTGEQYPSDKVGVTISSITTPGTSQMASDLISNMGIVMVPTGGLLALYFGLKASPFLIEAIKAFIARRL